MTTDDQFSAQQPPTGTRQVAVFFSDMVGFSALVEKLGDRVAGKMVQHVLEIQRAAIEKDGGGTVQRIVGDEVFGILDSPSVAMSRALEIQRQLAEWNAEDPDRPALQIRMGLHIGEIYLEEEGRLEIISRHINRAHRIMEAAGPNQILATSVVIEMGRDYIEEVPAKSLGIRRYGEFYLKGVGPTEICEVADLRVREPVPPVSLTKDTEQSIRSRLEEFGYVDPERVGAGHFGVVYKTRRRDEQQEIAVKVLNPIWVDDPECRRLFESEANRLKQLRLPGVIQIFGSHVSGSPPLFEMEWIDGLMLDASLEEEPPKRIAECFADICRVMAAAHDAGVVHGDLKPSNVMIRKDGSPVVLDFGLSARISDDDASSLSSSIIGTPAFVAPERIRDHTLTASGDIYSLGVMLYRVLAGRDPFDEPTVFGQLQCHLHEEPQLPSVFREGVSDNLQRICLKAMEKDISDRYQTVAEMAADLDRVIAGEVILIRPTAYDNLLFHPVRQHLDQVRRWGQRGLLSSEEEHRLQASYDGLTLRGMPAVMEARKLGFWQLLAYLGGWAIVNGAAVWLIVHWEQIESRLLRIGLGSMPILCMLATAAWMWKKQRYRITFAALVTLILATPVFSFVWLYEFELGSTVAVDKLSREVFQDHFSASSSLQPRPSLEEPRRFDDMEMDEPELLLDDDKDYRPGSKFRPRLDELETDELDEELLPSPPIPEPESPVDAETRQDPIPDPEPVTGNRRESMIHVTSSRQVHLQYELRENLAVREVQLWGTVDGGRSWQKWGIDADRTSPLQIAMEQDGLYGFRIVIEEEEGGRAHAPAAGADADIWIRVDSVLEGPIPSVEGPIPPIPSVEEPIPPIPSVEEPIPRPRAEPIKITVDFGAGPVEIPAPADVQLSQTQHAIAIVIFRLLHPTPSVEEPIPPILPPSPPIPSVEEPIPPIPSVEEPIPLIPSVEEPIPPILPPIPPIPSVVTDKQLFVNFADKKPIPLLTNLQLFLVATSMLIAAASVMFLTKTRTHSAQATFACLLCYITLLMVIPGGDLIPLILEEQWASIAARFFPLIGGVFLISQWMIHSPGRENQVIPWIYLLSITLVIVTIVVCEFGPEEWFESENEVGRSAEPWDARGNLMTIFGGIFLVGMGLGGRRLFRHRARLATFGMMLAGLVCIPLFLVLLGSEETYPDHWAQLIIWGQLIPLPHLVLPLVGVAITLSACRTQMLVFLVSGLATLAFSMFFLGTVYFHDRQGWPILVLVSGAICFLVSLTVELASSRNTVDDPVSGRRL